jgi:hypothetical protein
MGSNAAVWNPVEGVRIEKRAISRHLAQRFPAFIGIGYSIIRSHRSSNVISMPLYFQGTKNIPHPSISLAINDTELPATRLFGAIPITGSLSVSVRMPRFAPDSLGYLFIVSKVANGRFKVKDLAQTIDLSVASKDELLSLLRHCSGIEFSDHWYSELYQIRNNRQ